MIKLIQAFSELSQMNDPDISSSDSEDKNSSEELNLLVCQNGSLNGMLHLMHSLTESLSHLEILKEILSIHGQ